MFALIAIVLLAGFCQAGYEIEWKQQGSGPVPRRGQRVSVHCIGYGKNGDLKVSFWSTRKEGGGTGEPFEFQVGLGNVIKVRLSGVLHDELVTTFCSPQAWDEAVIQMPVGSRAVVHASADFAYGASGFPAWGIQPNSPLDFDIEVLSIKD